jgi:hypothetical protein
MKGAGGDSISSRSAAKQAAEKVPMFVIVSEAKNLSWIKTKDYERFFAQIGAQNDGIPLFSAACKAVWILETLRHG